MDQILRKDGERFILNMDVTDILAASERSTSSTFGDEIPEFLFHASRADCINRIVEEVLIPLRDDHDQQAGSMFRDIKTRNNEVIN